ncbi:hypothetical protein ACFV7Q_12370 [Streptomyces sp. NPDC059851]|uniref:hypothetical protein n=1 Tax=Streptomyces sp. NPDC059851 TaxID=3346971 RepID=UPI00366170AC
MGLCLFPDDGEVDGPDACFSYGSFAQFRRRLALAEGFQLGDMSGFGGHVAWNDVTTVLEPLLNHPDDHGRSLTSQECREILPRLEDVLSVWLSSGSHDSDMKEDISNARDLITVLKVCVQKNVELCFM